MTFQVPILTVSSKINCNCHILHVASISTVNSAQECDVGNPFSCKGGVFKMITHVLTLQHSDLPYASLLSDTLDLNIK